MSISPSGPWNSLEYGNGLGVARTFDEQYRLIEQTGPAAYVWTPDPAGNITALADQLDPSSNQSFAYDVLHRLENDSGDYGQKAFTYDANGNRELRVWSGTFGSLTQTLGYEPDSNRLDTLDAMPVTLNAAGQMTGDGGVRTFEYNAAGRLARVLVNGQEVASYIYNGLGQRAIKTLPNGLQIFYHYGLNGELLSENDWIGQQATEYAYLEGAPIASFTQGSLVDSDGDGWPDPTDNCVDEANPGQLDTNGDGYGNHCDADLDNNGIVNQIDLGILRNSLGQSGQQDADLDGNGIVNQIDLGRLRSRFGAPPGPSGTEGEAGQGALVYLHADHLGTPRAGTDLYGTEVWRWHSDAFGEGAPDFDPDGDSNTVSVNLRFPGQYFDVESGLYYNWNRYYSPETGRYITSDPIGLRGGMNTYAYVDANPTTFFDPEGQIKRRRIGDPDVTVICGYYNQVCQRTGGKCNYPCNTAPFICRNPDMIPSLWIGVSDSQVSCIRTCLIEEDKKSRRSEDKRNDDCDDDDCLANDVIEDYHETCYTRCGVGSWRFPGLMGLGN